MRKFWSLAAKVYRYPFPFSKVSHIVWLIHKHIIYAAYSMTHINWTDGQSSTLEIEKIEARQKYNFV